MKKAITKRILLIFLVFNLIMCSIFPTTTQAGFFDWANVVGGKLFQPFFELLCGIGDLGIKMLQETFLGDGEIKLGGISEIESNEFYIRYSPGVIFSGGVPGLDVNFINPNFQDSQGNDTYHITKVTGEWVDVGDYSLDDEELKAIGFDSNTMKPRYTNSDGERYAFIFQVNTENDHAVYEWTDPNTKVSYTLVNTTASELELKNFLDSGLAILDNFIQKGVDEIQKIFRNRMDFI